MARTALLIIDVQNDILAGLGGDRAPLHAAALDATVGRIAGLLGAARRAGAPVVHVQHDDGPGHRLEKGTTGWEIRRELTPAEGEPVVHKTSCDAFWETELDATLKARGIDRLVIAGCMTQYCVDTTTRRAVTMGYPVTLAADGHMTADLGALTFDQIIAHHNALLDGFDAGTAAVAVRKAAEIAF